MLNSQPTHPAAENQLLTRRKSGDVGALVRSPRHAEVRSRQHAHAEGDFQGDYNIGSPGPASPMEAGIRPHHPFHVAAPHSSKASGNRWLTRATALSAFNVAVALLIHRFMAVVGDKQADLFYLYYQPFAPFLVMLWLWGVNVRVFERSGIRYDACFPPEEHKFLLSSSSIFQIANVLSAVVLSSAATFLFYCIEGNFEAAGFQPPLIYSAMLVILLLPATVFYQDTRRFFASTAWRVMTPIRSVTWSDFLLADVLTSLAKGISDTERAVCAMATGPVMAPLGDACSDASWILPFGLALPYAWRLVQCLRVHADTGARPQLWNALKYSTAFPVIALSAVKYHVTQEAWRSFWKPLWLGAALINSVYSCIWDVERDWEVSFFTQMKAQKTLLPKPVLPTPVQYRRPFYIYLMISNAVMRLAWAYKLSPHLRRNHATVLCIVLLEAVRRFQWMFVRVEVELRKIQGLKPELGTLVPAQPPHSHVGGAPLENGEPGVVLASLEGKL